MIDAELLTGFDLETTSLKPWDGRINSFAAYGTESKVVKLPSHEQLREFLADCASKNRILVGWNVMFDVTWLLAYGLEKEVRACRWLDAMLLLKRVDGWRYNYSLKTVVREIWPAHGGYELDDYSTPTTDEGWTKYLEYNLKDVMFTLTLAKMYLKNLTERELNMAEIESETIVEFAGAWLSGIHIDTDALSKLKKENTTQLTALRIELGIPVSVLASTKQLANVLYHEWQLPILDRTEKGAPSTSKDALNKLAVETGDERIKQLLLMRKCMTIKGKYVEAVEKSIALHGKAITHPQPQIGGTYTSRLTYSSKQGKGKTEEQTGIALHQWSRDKRVRSELIPPPGFLLAEWDFSGQEMRLMADASMDDTMLSLFLDGVDGHAYMGGEIKGLDWQWIHDNQDTDPEAKSARYLGKFANLSLQYRIGLATMRVRALTQYGLNLTEGEAYNISNRYKLAYQKVPVYWFDAVARAAKHGYAETRGGHRIQLSDLEEYAQQQTAINFPIQGTGGDMKLLAISVAKNHFAQLGMYLAWDLHDALFAYIPDDAKAIEKALFIKRLLSNLPYEKAWGWTPAVPMPVDGKIGKSWGELKEVKE